MNNNIWLTADTHFSHFNILAYCQRPYCSTHEMNVDITNKWNDLIQKEDIVYHLGDFSFGNPEKHLSKLNGKITLIYGNHDRKKYNKYFCEVKQTQELIIGEFKCLLTHIPLIDSEYYKKDKWPSLDLINQYDNIFCGHIHQRWKVNDKHINVGVDVWDMKPNNINDLYIFLKQLKERA
jgi:calcineurin-like phosphoesterase family protein